MSEQNDVINDMVKEKADIDRRLAEARDRMVADLMAVAEDEFFWQKKRLGLGNVAPVALDLTKTDVEGTVAEVWEKFRDQFNIWYMEGQYVGL